MGCPSVFPSVPIQTENSEGEDSILGHQLEGELRCTWETLLGSGSQLGTEREGVTPTWVGSVPHAQGQGVGTGGEQG